MNTEQELKGINAHLNSLYLEMNAIKARVEYLSQQSDPNHYIPQPGEVVEVATARKVFVTRIFTRYDPSSKTPFMTVVNELTHSDCDSYRKGLYYGETDWRYCRRLHGEIIEFGCDKVKDYTHLLPTGYEFCSEEDRTDWLKVELKGITEEQKLGSIGKVVHPDWVDFYRPIRKIQYHIAVHEAVTVETTPYNLLLLADGRKFRISDKIKMADHDGMVLITPDSIDANRYFSNNQLKPEYLGLPTIDRIEDIPNPYAVDWSNAPEWADSHAFDQNEIGVFYGVERGERQHKPKWSASGLLLPSGLDWTKSKTVRPCKP